MPDFTALNQRLCAAIQRILDQDRYGDAFRLGRRWEAWKERQLAIAERAADYYYDRLTR